jgi:mRNA interferase MazF
MLRPGQIVAFQFPQTDLAQGKLRPALLIAQLPGPYDDWLTCMISSQVKQFVTELDELITPQESDFKLSGLSTISVIRTSRLAVVAAEIFVGQLGEIAPERHHRIRQRLSDWLLSDQHTR